MAENGSQQAPVTGQPPILLDARSLPAYGALSAGIMSIANSLRHAFGWDPKVFALIVSLVLCIAIGVAGLKHLTSDARIYQVVSSVINGFIVYCAAFGLNNGISKATDQAKPAEAEVVKPNVSSGAPNALNSSLKIYAADMDDVAFVNFSMSDDPKITYFRKDLEYDVDLGVSQHFEEVTKASPDWSYYMSDVMAEGQDPSRIYVVSDAESQSVSPVSDKKQPKRFFNEW